MYIYYQVFKDSTLIGGFKCLSSDLAACCKSAILSGFRVEVYNVSDSFDSDDFWV